MTSINAKRNRETVERLFEAFRAGNTDAFDVLIVGNAQHVADDGDRQRITIRMGPPRAIPTMT